MKRNLFARISSLKKRLAICTCTSDDYEPMKYYEVIWIHDVEDKAVINASRGCGDGYFIKNNKTHTYDFFTSQEFNKSFLIVDEANSILARILNIFSWLKKNKGITINVYPVISDDGYNYFYAFNNFYGFACSDEGYHFDSYELAAKEAITLARKKCIHNFGKTVSSWFTFIVFKK